MATTNARSADEKAAALAIAGREGLAEAAHQTGIPRQTIHRWMKEAGIAGDSSPRTAAATAAASERKRLLRAQLAIKLLQKAHAALDRMGRPHVEFKGDRATKVVYPTAPAAAVRDYAVAAGVLIDKFRLEEGEATSRSESRDITNSLNDHEKALLRDAIDALDAEAGDALAGEAVGAPEDARADVRE